MKKFIKRFNNLIKNIIFKLENKTNNKFQISTFNKFIITFICLLFFYLFYLSIPILYSKSWVQSNIEQKPKGITQSKERDRPKILWIYKGSQVS